MMKLETQIGLDPGVTRQLPWSDHIEMNGMLNWFVLQSDFDYVQHTSV